MLKVLTIIMSLFIVGCGIDYNPKHLFEETKIDKSLTPFVEEFMSQCITNKGVEFCKRKINIVSNIKEVKDYKELSGYGNCKKEKINLLTFETNYRQEITILTHNRNGVRFSNEQIKQIVWHEFGHCFFNLKHDEIEIMSTKLIPQDESASDKIVSLWKYVR